MNRAIVFYIVTSIIITAATSAPEIGPHDNVGAFTLSRAATISSAETSEQANYSTPSSTLQILTRNTTNTATQSSYVTAEPRLTNTKLFEVGSTAAVVSTIKSIYPNWVGPASKASDTACYRESHITKTCPLEFNSKWDTCWAQCPLEYPVKCGMECIRQNDDCKLEIVSKVAVVFQSVMALALFNLYGEFKLMSKAVRTAFRCAKEMAILVKQLTKYVRNIKVTDPQTSQAQLLALLYQTDNMVFDFPVTIATCMGIIVKPNIRFADKITNTAELVLKEVIASSDSIVKSWDSFKAFMKRILLGDSISSLNNTDITSLKTAMNSNTTCEYDLKRLADRTWMTILSLRKQNPKLSENDLRVVMSKSNLVLNDVPIVTNNCMNELIVESDEKTAYGTRATLRKTFGVIVEDLIKSGTSNNGTFLTAEEYAYKIADKAMSFYGVWDIKGVTNVVGEYFQTICGPTRYTGDIDDGPASKALGLTTVDKAFNGSSGTWTKESDGSVSLIFHSRDTEDVTVNILSAGDKVDEVAVSAGGSAIWSSNVSALGGKTLYLDRWRPGFLGLPGTGGGSLLLWVPDRLKGS
ncbi:unnamed protein product [Phytophthora lilii]|uniref:Unnamed protein product n=1 Tax=Phytophthora lilii TaxID=2077276 RepID=A0A9W6TG80_9STRA|nr:unnamed protein product [Phytophthora lilii]